MPEPLDVYVDTYQVGSTPWHGTINFSLTRAQPVPPGQPQQADPVVTVRMSLEGMKLLAFFLYRQIRQHEDTLNVGIDVPAQVLNAVGIGTEDWRTFWTRLGGGGPRL